MIYTNMQMEEQAILQTASRMCAAARTAPKTCGIDNILTLVLTGDEKNALAEKMHEVAKREFGETANNFDRDAENLFASQAVVLIGVKRAYSGLSFCSFCGFDSCLKCKEANGRCSFNFLDLGIAICSAASIAAEDRVDNRIMFSIGKVAAEMGYMEDTSILWHGIPISVSGKSIFFDRK